MQVQADCSQASAQFNLISTVSLSLPSYTTNNEALYYYSGYYYTIGKIVKYLSLVIAVVSIILLILGYFGCKLLSIECIAVVQLAGLLLVTIDNMGSTYPGLKYLSLTLGITSFHNYYYYEDTKVPLHIRTIVTSNNTIYFINIFLLVILIPIIVGIVIKILSATVYK